MIITWFLYIRIVIKMFVLLQIPLGRQCVEHYRSLNRYCVFSHDEMVCNVAAKADSLELEMASAIQRDMSIMIEEEKKLREKAYKLVRQGNCSLLVARFIYLTIL